MDAFFASVEQRDRPELRDKPVIVGASPEHRGVVCAASYEARKFGVRSALPSRTAKNLCPNGIFVQPNLSKYRAESEIIMDIIRSYCETIEQVSIDEAYLDMTRQCSAECPERSLLAALPIAKEIKERIFSERSITISIGIAGNKMLSKIASDYDKPDGLILIPDRDKTAFLASLPVRAIHGVGKASEIILKNAGLNTVLDIQNYSEPLEHLLGSYGSILKGFALGEDERPVESNDSVKSISSETTFRQDTEDRMALKQALRDQSEEIALKLRRHGLHAHTLQVKVRYSDFTTLSRQITLSEGTQDPSVIYRNICQLLAKDRLVNQPLRLIGISAAKLWELEHFQMKLPLDYPTMTNGK